MEGTALSSGVVGSALGSSMVGSALGSSMVGSTLGRGLGSSLGWSLSSSLGGGFGSSLGGSLGSSFGGLGRGLASKLHPSNAQLINFIVELSPLVTQGRQLTLPVLEAPLNSTQRLKRALTPRVLVRGERGDCQQHRGCSYSSK